MRSYNPIDPFSLDEPDVRLPAGTSTFGALPPVGKLIDDLEALGVDVPDAAHWRDLVAATQAPAAPPSAPGLDFTAEQVAAYIRESAAHQSTDLVPARQRAAAAIDKATAAKRAARRKVAAPKPAQLDDAYPAHWTEAGRARLAKAHAAQLDDPSTRYPENWKR